MAVLKSPVDGKEVWGLAAAGAISKSFLGRIPGLNRFLGPVVSTSYRLASRIANTLRAGTPMRDHSSLAQASVILLCHPGVSLKQILPLDAFDWSGKIILTTETDALTAKALRNRGAAVASLSALSDLPDRFLIEGDPAATVQAKALVRLMRAAHVEVSQDCLLLFQSALTFSGSLFTPMLESTVDILRQSGLEPRLATQLAESLFEQSLRGYRRAGRKSWRGPIPHADGKTIHAQHQAIEAVKPLLADYFRDSARHGFHLYRTFPDLTRRKTYRGKTP